MLCDEILQSGWCEISGSLSCKIVFVVGHFLFKFSDTFIIDRMFRLATMHSVTDRRQDYLASVRS